MPPPAPDNSESEHALSATNSVADDDAVPADTVFCALIPVYNHVSQLEQVISAVRTYQLPVILVDDGSSSECALRIDAMRSEWVGVLRHDSNQGKGAAIKTGLMHAAERGYSHVLQVDADGQHDLEDVPQLVKAALAQPDAVISGRPVYDDSVPRSRLWGRYLTHIWVWINTLSFTVKDSMCGFRVYPVPAANTLLQREHVGDRMDFDIEFLVRWVWRGGVLQQLNTKVIYPEDGHSNFRLLQDNWLITRMHTRLFFGMLWRLPSLLVRKWQNR